MSTLSPILVVTLVLCFAGAIAVVVGGIMVHVGEREGFRESLRSLDEVYQFVALRDQELLVPFKDRVLGPLVERLSGVGGKYAPSSYVLTIRSKFLRAGELDPSAAERFLGIKALGLIGGVGGTLFIFLAKPLGGGLSNIMAAALVGFIGIMGPDASLNRRVEAREKAVLKQLPDILDLLVICVEAGLGFNAALARAVASIEEGEIVEEFSLALGEMKAGATRSEALGGLGERVQIKEVQSFVTALRQADRFGVSISSTLREQAKDIRISRSQKAREAAQKAPVKMLMPMVFFIFPPLFMLILAPAFLNIARSGAF
jgi:tight adherence protein C